MIRGTVHVALQSARLLDDQMIRRSGKAGEQNFIQPGPLRLVG